MVGIFTLAGIPEGVELLFKIPSGEIDTHVLMTLACFGTLAIGAAMEVSLSAGILKKLSRLSGPAMKPILIVF